MKNLFSSAAFALLITTTTAFAGGIFGGDGGLIGGDVGNFLDQIPILPPLTPFQSIQPRQSVQQQVQMGNRCMTPVGVSGYGPSQPLGSFCHMGPYSGVVIQ